MSGNPLPAEAMRLPAVDTNLILGIDPGIEGAVALLSSAGELIAVHDLPTLPDGAAGRRRVNPALLAELLAKTHAGTLIASWSTRARLTATSRRFLLA